MGDWLAVAIDAGRPGYALTDSPVSAASFCFSSNHEPLLLHLAKVGWGEDNCGHGDPGGFR